ncbi:MAG TPA: hypothetical protein DEA44_17605 [Firmicutes bacterium]|nr:hypothetical protein [Bacillota bacterium]
MKSARSGINATAATVNLANILTSRFSNVRQSGLIFLINTADKQDVATGDGLETAEIRLSLNGELSINGKKIDPGKPIPGYRVFMDTKQSKSN